MDGKYEAMTSEGAQRAIGRPEEGKQITPETQPLAPITLLYGFTQFRDYYAGQESSRDRNIEIVLIDDMNHSLDLRDRVLKDYAGTIRAIRNMGGSVNQAQEAHYMDKAYELMRETGIKKPQHALSLILSWRKFLSDNASKLRIISLIKKSKMSAVPRKEATRRLFGFFNKNLYGELHNKEKEIKSVMKLGQLLNGPNPEIDISEAMKSNEDIGLAVCGAFFRKLSKLGLDWARSQPQLNTVFVEGAFSDEMKHNKDQCSDSTHWRSFTQEDERGLSEKPYFIVNRRASYLPITYSEMKHVRRMNYDVERVDIMKYASESVPGGVK